MMIGPIQHFRSAIWQAWQDKEAADLCKRKGFRGELRFDIYGSHQQLASSHLRERDQMLLRAILQEEFRTVFLLSKAKNEDIRCRFCNAPDGHLFQQPRVPSLNEKGPHRLASLLALAWLASWVDITVHWVTLSRGGQ